MLVRLRLLLCVDLHISPIIKKKKRGDRYQVPPLLEPQRAHRRRRPPQPALRPLRRRGG